MSVSGLGGGPSDATGAAMHEQGPDRRSVARGAWFGLWVQAVDKILPVVLILYLARILDAEAFGVYSFVIAYLAFFQLVSDTSIDTVLVRTMSEQPTQRLALLRAGIGLKLVMALISATVATAAVGVVSGGGVSYGLMATASLVLPSTLGGAYRAYLRSGMRIHGVLMIATVRATLLATGVFAAVTAGAGLPLIFASMAAANLTTFLVVAAALRSEVAPRVDADTLLWRRLLRGAAPLVANALAMTVSLRIGHILLMSMRGPVDVGLLGAAARVTEAFSLLPEALMISVLPLMSAMHARGSNALRTTSQRVARYLVVATGVPVLVCAVAGRPVMGFLFGTSFADSGPLLALLAYTALLSATGTVILNLLVAVHREGALSRNTMVFAVINVVLSFVLIRHHGALGAALAPLATSLASQVSLALLPSTRDHARPVLLASLRAMAAVVVAALVGRQCDSPLAAVGSGLLTYATLLVALKVATVDEFRFLRSMAHSARGSGGALES